MSCPSAALRRPLPRQLPQPEPQGVHTESLARAQVCPDTAHSKVRVSVTPTLFPRTGSRGRQRDLLGTRRNMQAERRCNVRVFCVANHTVAAEHATRWSQGDGGGFQTSERSFAASPGLSLVRGEGRLAGRTDFSHTRESSDVQEGFGSGIHAHASRISKHAAKFPDLRKPSRPFPVPVQARDLAISRSAAVISSAIRRSRHVTGSRHWCLFTKERVW